MFDRLKKKVIKEALDTVQVEVKKKASPYIEGAVIIISAAALLYAIFKGFSPSSPPVPPSVNVTCNLYLMPPIQ